TIWRNFCESESLGSERGALLYMVLSDGIKDDLMEENRQCHRIAINDCMRMIFHLAQQRSDVLNCMVLPVRLGVCFKEFVQYRLCTCDLAIVATREITPRIREELSRIHPAYSRAKDKVSPPRRLRTQNISRWLRNASK